jgi:peptidoglycan hydrolase-like protein with peptidoglycan-binding domain
MNNDDQKIVWKKGSQSSRGDVADDNSSQQPSQANELSSPQPESHQMFSRIPNIDVQDIAQKSSEYKKNSYQNEPIEDTKINDLRSEINAAFSGDTEKKPIESDISIKKQVELLEKNKETPFKNVFQIKMDKLKNLSNSDKADVLPDIEISENMLEKEVLEKEPLMKKSTEKSDQDLINELKSDIQKNFDVQGSKSDVQEEKKFEKGLGIAQTYYSDLSGAMSANEPATMSELIQRSRFEKKAESITSLKSSKNIFFIVGAVLFVISTLIVIFTFFKPGEKVEFITREKVPSLVNSERHTGINTTDLDTSLLKQTIRKVVEKKISEDTINQIYYVVKDTSGNIKRLGIKDVFDKTENQVPSLLYDTIENDFMHGVYRADKNYPFMVLKSLSYDRALIGMKQWEPTMIDDLATYFDLPPEATDRSLLKDGFEDDLIKNKNVRVVRFLPRAFDRRGILKILNIDSFKKDKSLNNTSQEVEKNAEDFVPDILKVSNLLSFLPKNISNLFVSQAMAERDLGGVDFKNLENSNFIQAGENINIRVNDNLCVSADNSVVPEGSPGAYCFKPLSDNAINNVQPNKPLSDNAINNVQPNQCQDLPQDELRQLAAGAAIQIKLIAGISSALGVGPDVVNTLNNTSNFLLQYAYGNILKNEAVRTGALIVQQAEQVLNIIDQDKILPQRGPGGGRSLYGYLRDLIHITKCSLGIADSLQWQTLGRIPQGATLYSGQSLEGVTYVQQSFVLLGIMDPISITGRIDVLTQDAISRFQLANGLAITGILDPNTLLLLGLIQDQQDTFLGGDSAIITDYLALPGTRVSGAAALMSLGEYNSEIQILQTILTAEGYPIKTNSGLFDQSTCDALRGYQRTNNLIQADSKKCTVSIETFVSLNNLIDKRGWLSTNNGLNGSGTSNGGDIGTNNGLNGSGTSNGGDIGTNNGIQGVNIRDYFSLGNQIGGVNAESNLSLGAYNKDVQSLQIFLYGEGYDIPIINGLYDKVTCDAVREFEGENSLIKADIETCTISASTVETLNDLIRQKNYLGGGFITTPTGDFKGVGPLEGQTPPGSLNFINIVEADSLKEGDVVLMYMFLDENTILITRHEQVIEEVIRRRALSGIFN